MPPRGESFADRLLAIGQERLAKDKGDGGQRPEGVEPAQQTVRECGMGCKRRRCFAWKWEGPGEKSRSGPPAALASGEWGGDGRKKKRELACGKSLLITNAWFPATGSPQCVAVASSGPHESRMEESPAAARPGSGQRRDGQRKAARSGGNSWRWETGGERTQTVQERAGWGTDSFPGRHVVTESPPWTAKP